jgi:IS5 family transposase
MQRRMTMDLVRFAEYAAKRKKSRSEVFLYEMELVLPWQALVRVNAPFYPIAGRGRRP